MRRGEEGFTFVLALAVIATFSIGVAAAAQMWIEQSRRDRESDVLRIGGAYARAIESYYRRGPEGANQFPSSLEDLVADRRSGQLARHIRKLYPDPTNRGRAWQVLRTPDGRVRGVFIDSNIQPIRDFAFRANGVDLAAGKMYSQWHFSPSLQFYR